MPRRLVIALGLLLLIAAAPVGASAGSARGNAAPAASAPAGQDINVRDHFIQLGHNPLFSRGMNAAPAIFRHFIYIGNRTDSSQTCANGLTGCTHPHPGVLVLDIANPFKPTVVGEIGPPEEGAVGQTSRELRVWPQAGLLAIMNFRCSSVIHVCPAGTPEVFDIKFYDVAADPAHPRLVSTYVPSFKPHEMFLWLDPRHRGRALLYVSTPTLSTDPAVPTLIVTDISRAREGVFTEIAKGNWNDLFPADVVASRNLFVHSMGTTPDGTRTYLAYEAGEFLVLDTTDLARGVPNPQMRRLTDIANRPIWTNPNGHTSVKVPGRPLALTTDEIYGKLLGPNHGCPWGGMRLIDLRDEAHPTILSEYKVLPQDDPAFCQTPAGQDDQRVSYSSHNPTVLPDLALIAWHSEGLQAVDLSDPAHPTQAGQFVPDPLPSVATEDPALSLGPGKVVMWSYPIIRKGLVYVVDIRNGLYVLAYVGPHAAEVSGIELLEGNSNLGDAARLERGRTP